MSGKIAVILAAHGAGDDSIANNAIRCLAQQVSHHVHFPVIAAFNLGRPTYEEAIASIEAARILVVPLMTSAGYFACDVLPRRFADPRCSMGDVVGIQRALIDVLAARTERTLAAAKFTASTTTVIVVGHGTERSPSSGESTFALASAIAARIHGIDARAAFLDQEPRLEQIRGAITTPDVIVVPFFIGGGYHASVDIAARLGIDAVAPMKVCAHGPHRFIFEPPLLDMPELLEMIVNCIDERVGSLPIRLGTRRSPLALWQADRVATAIHHATKRRIERVPFEASGDVDLLTPVDQLPGASPFTDVVTTALSRGEIDFATHSLKDLPLNDDPRLLVVAVLPRGAVHEVLIARGGMRIADLPQGARVGVSCARRAVQLRWLRADLIAAPIRGPVDSRIAQVLQGHYDAAILAAAGVERLGLEQHITQRFALEEMMPAAGQGAIAIQTRADDNASIDIARRVNDLPTWLAVQTELALARHLEDRYVVAVCAEVEADDQIALTFKAFTRDGRRSFGGIMRGRDPQPLADQAARAALRYLEGREVWEDAA